MLLQDVLKEFVFECEIRKYTKRTIKGYRNNNALFFNYLESEFNITELEEVKQVNIKCYIQFLMKKGLAPILAGITSHRHS